MTSQFEYDVFLSHSSHDIGLVRELAGRLRTDGLKVWFRIWQHSTEENYAASPAEGMEQSRTLVLCMSPSTFGSEWPQLRADTLRFRDPQDPHRRFIPLRIKECNIDSSLSNLLYIDLCSEARESEYARLLSACRFPLDILQLDTNHLCRQALQLAVQLSFEFAWVDAPEEITNYTLSPSGSFALTGDINNIIRLWDIRKNRCSRTLLGHNSLIDQQHDDEYYYGDDDDYYDLDDSDFYDEASDQIAKGILWIDVSPDGKHIISSGFDQSARLWLFETGRHLGTIYGNGAAFTAMVWMDSKERVILGLSDGSIVEWGLESNSVYTLFEGHLHGVSGLSISKDQAYLLSTGYDGTLRYWNIGTGGCVSILAASPVPILCLSWDSEQNLALCGMQDGTLQLYDTEYGRCLRVMEGHINFIQCLSWNFDTGLALSGSSDGTVRLWDVASGRCLQILRGHGTSVASVSWGDDDYTAFSADRGGVFRSWNLSILFNSADNEASATSSNLSQREYTNAKVLLVGDSGAGKTGLSNRLALGIYEKTDSTVGAWATQWKLPAISNDNIERDIWLWDFGGQADQRLIHQLYMDQTHLIVLVFDPQRSDIFNTLASWDRDLTKAAPQGYRKLLVAGRIDAGGLRATTRSKVEEFGRSHGYSYYIETSAKENLGCEELRSRIVEMIDWQGISERTAPALFQRLKTEIVHLKDEGRVLIRFSDLRETLTLRLEGNQFADEELRAVLRLLAGPGVVWNFSFGGWVLLQPELLNSHAQAIIRTIRQDPRGLGCIAEHRVLSSDLAFSQTEPRLEPSDERIVLLSIHRILLGRGLCWRDEDPAEKSPTMLVFPSYVQRERPSLVEHPAVVVSYRFDGFLDEIYATLVVRLHHTQPFERDQLWKDGADFLTMIGKRLGVKLLRHADGEGELKVYCAPEIPLTEIISFNKYIHEHLRRRASNVVRLRHYLCSSCNTPVMNREVAMKKLRQKGTNATIVCVECEKRVPLWDDLEKKFGAPEVKRMVQALENQTQKTLDNESKERALVGEVISTVGLAGQLSREFSVSDHGIDMEIEFKNDDGDATGRKVYLQLKSGSSYLRHRLRDGAEIFQINKERHVKYWMNQQFPVMLIIRNSAGEIRWMEIRDWLRQETNNGESLVRQIPFKGNKFDVRSIQEWRAEALRERSH